MATDLWGLPKPSSAPKQKKASKPSTNKKPASDQGDLAAWGVGGSSGLDGPGSNPLPFQTEPVWNLPKPKTQPYNGLDFGKLGKLLAGVGTNAANAAVSGQGDVNGTKSFLDYLKQAESMAPGGTDYSALRDQLKSDAGMSDARIAAMYKQLQGSYAADAPGIKKNYDGAKKSVKKDASDAVAATDEAYNSTRDAQSAQLAALGIGDAAAVLASQGGAAAADQSHAAANIRQNEATNKNQLTQNGATAEQYNTGIKGAAGLEGNLQRAVIQKQLQDKLAELSTQQSTEDAQRKSSLYSMAMNLQSAAQSGGLTAQQKAENDAALAKLLEQQNEFGARQSSSNQNSQAQMYATLLKIYNGDSAKAAADMKTLFPGG